MILSIVKDIVDVGLLISQQIKKAKINLAQCQRLGERITIVVEAVRGLEGLSASAAQRYVMPLTQLQSILTECLTFVTVYNTKSFAKRFLAADKYERNFNNLYQQLDEDIQTLGLSIDTTQLFNHAQDQEDKARDKQELLNNMSTLLATGKKTLLETQRLKVAQEERDRLITEQLASLRKTLLADVAGTKAAAKSPDKLASLLVEFHTLQIDSKLAVGLLGDIYLGRRYEQPVSIKAVALAHEGDVRAHFRHEVKLLKQLAHPNIVQLLHVSETKTHSYLVMEALKRGALADYTSSYPLPLKRRHQLAMDILLGLNYLHSEQIAHRRINPQTILVTQKGTAKLANFSFSKTLEQSFISADELAKEGLTYFAPEIVLGTKPISRITTDDYIKADMYSVGVLLWELLTGQSYWGRMSAPDLIEKLKAQVQCPIFPLLPLPYQTLIQACLSHDPLKRPTSAQALQKLKEAKAVLLKQIESETAFYNAGLNKEKNQDLEGAKSNYQMAAYYGSPRALTNLGVFYAQGKGGLVQSPEKAHRYFKAAANNGHVRAMENLAWQYAKGEGVTQKISKAVFWYQRAQQGGSQVAAKALQDYQGVALNRV